MKDVLAIIMIPLSIIYMLSSAPITTKATNTIPFNPSNSAFKVETSSHDLVEVCKEITNSYLNEFKNKDVISTQRIDAFTLNNIFTVYGDINNFDFVVGYSVKPHNKKSYWDTGSGYRDKNWIIEKNAFIKVQKQNGSYFITDISDGV